MTVPALTETDRPVIEVVNPATGATVGSYPTHSREEVDGFLDAATQAQAAWAAEPVATRAGVLRAVAERLRADRQRLAALMTSEMGKPINEAIAEVEKSAWACEYYAESGPAFLAPEPVKTENASSWISYEPIGTVLAVMPWNFPYWQVLRFAAPTLLAGNAAILKHSPNVTGSALAIAQLFVDAGLPVGLFTTLVIAEPEVPKITGALIADDRIAAVTITGSERAGAAVAAAAGRAIKKSVMELGGSDPFVVLADADLDLAVTSAVRGRFINSGQSCLAAKRFIVHESLVAEFSTRFAEAVRDLEVGDPTMVTSTVGPIARADLVDALDRLVQDSIGQGATALVGGARIDRPGSWYAPTVLTDVTETMPVMVQETFGPVAAVIAARDDDEAVRIANLSRYGLGASVWSTDPAHALAVGTRIVSGALFINATVASDPRLPFGGTKKSGYGRELGAAGAVEFTNVRTIVLGTGILAQGAPTE